MEPNITPDELTPQQKAAFNQAVDLLSEHFDSVLMIAVTEPALSNRSDDCTRRISYRQGGYHQILGMAMQYQHDMLQEKAED